MNPTIWTFIGGVIGVVVTTLGSYLVTRLKNSGKVDTTEAAILWAESQAMRKELRDEVVSLRNQLTLAQQEIILMRERLNKLEGKKRRKHGQSNPKIR